MIDWVEIGISGGAIGKLGISHRLHNDETLTVLVNGFSISHPKRCLLSVNSFWVSSQRFDKVLKRWRRYGIQSHGMKVN